MYYLKEYIDSNYINIFEAVKHNIVIFKMRLNGIENRLDEIINNTNIKKSKKRPYMVRILIFN